MRRSVKSARSSASRSRSTRCRSSVRASFPLPAFIAERHFFFEALVDPNARHEPSLDGSALEHGGAVVALPVAEALERCRTGEFQDGKTELCLRRLVERYPDGAP